ncbi:nitroreductase [Sneathiella sp.]|uniref:nitroreductase family protein n=1 Tax=Sneathiella sp. TaxID=1964365 RepID=UPI0035651F9B
MDAIEALTTRKSVAMLTEPGPSGDELAILMQAAVRAPDHCHLRPWRFLVIKGEAREALGDIFMEAQRRREPEATEAALMKTRSKPLRAPLIIVVVAKIEIDNPKVPPIEQILSAGAAAQNIMNAAHAMGYGGIWRSGKPCFDEYVRTSLGAGANDQIVGFLYLGTAARAPILPKEEISSFMEVWTG